MRNRAKRGRVKAQDFGTELDVTRLVNTVDVAERQSGQVTAVLAKTESLNGLQRIFGGGVELLVDLADNTVFSSLPTTPISISRMVLAFWERARSSLAIHP